MRRAVIGTCVRTEIWYSDHNQSCHRTPPKCGVFRFVPRLTTLKSTLQQLPARIARPAINERLRGRAAMERTARIKARDLYTCQDCGRVTRELEVDHTVPLWQGGADVDANLGSLCIDCHAAKTAREAAMRAGRTA